jgi:DNA-binding CsgD family transcriptional regulator
VLASKAPPSPEAEENAVFSVCSQSGFLLLDKSLGPVASNQEAIRILTYPNIPERIKRMDVFLGDKIRAGLVSRQSSSGLEFVKEFKSGRRRYFCRSFPVETNGKGMPLVAALLFERCSSSTTALAQVGQDFELTQREKETVELLIQGLTSKEIATRMKISPNTVKAFLRIVMVKMGVSTRSGILGKVIGPGA